MRPVLPLAIPLVFALTGGVAPARSADSVTPGYWEAREEVLSPIHSLKVERRCITPQQVSRFMGCYINHHYQCTCPEQSAHDGVVVFKGHCVDNKGRRVGVEGRGTYTPTTLRMDAHVAFRLLGIPLSGEATTDAHRLGDVCPPGAR